MSNFIFVGACTAQLILLCQKRADTNSGVMLNNYQIKAGSDGARIALTLSNIGYKTHFIGNNIGFDNYAKQILDEFNQHKNFSHSISQSKNVQTAIGVAIASEDGNREWYLFNPGLEELIINCDFSNIKKGCIVYIDSYYYLFKASIKAIQATKAIGAISFVNLGQISLILEKCKKSDIYWVLENSDWIQISINEGQKFDQILSVFKDCNYKNLLVTQGSKGAFLYRKDKPTIHQNAIQTKSLNPAGAGANFSCGFLYSMINNSSIKECLKFANVFASYYIQLKEKSKISIDDVENFRRENEYQ